ncbi:MAG: hypothetical protein CEN89_775, partial [Candidatus Berkelbacteria bacterium Licking1014_7]
RWALSNLIVKIIWQKDGLKLSSGFIVGDRRQAAIDLKTELDRLIGKKE